MSRLGVSIWLTRNMWYVYISSFMNNFIIIIIRLNKFEININNVKANYTHKQKPFYRINTRLTLLQNNHICATISI